MTFLRVLDCRWRTARSSVPFSRRRSSPLIKICLPFFSPSPVATRRKPPGRGSKETKKEKSLVPRDILAEFCNVQTETTISPMLSFLTVALVAVLVLPTYGKWNVTRQTPNATALVTTRQFTIESKRAENRSRDTRVALVDSAVNRPTFRSLIRFLNGKSNASIEQIDVSNTSSSANYSNNTLSFALQNPARWNFNDEFYILFDDGVLFSGNATNSSAQTSMQFWYLKIIDTSATMMPSDTSARAMTTMPYTSGAADTTGQNSNTSTVSFIAGLMPISSIVSAERPSFRCA